MDRPHAKSAPVERPNPFPSAPTLDLFLCFNLWGKSCGIAGKAIRLEPKCAVRVLVPLTAPNNHMRKSHNDRQVRQLTLGAPARRSGDAPQCRQDLKLSACSTVSPLCDQNNYCAPTGRPSASAVRCGYAPSHLSPICTPPCELATEPASTLWMGRV